MRNEAAARAAYEAFMRCEPTIRPWEELLEIDRRNFAAAAEAAIMTFCDRMTAAAELEQFTRQTASQVASLFSIATQVKP